MANSTFSLGIGQGIEYAGIPISGSGNTVVPTSRNMCPGIVRTYHNVKWYNPEYAFVSSVMTIPYFGVPGHNRSWI